MCTYSQKAKKELLEISQNRQKNIVELATLLLLNAVFIQNNSLTAFNIILSTENKFLALKVFTLLLKTFNIKVECFTRKKNSKYTIVILPSNSSAKILQACKLVVDNKINTSLLSRLLLRTLDDKRYFLRACFLSTGFLSNPEKGYHLELVLNSKSITEQLCTIIEEFGIDTKVIKRRHNFVIYFKEATQIVNILNIIMAHKTLFDFENTRLLKEVRNNINRVVNFETANSQRTISASVEQLNNISYINSTVGLEALEPTLKEIAYIRLENKEASLQELGKLLATPIGKSGVNHRLKKINKIAEDLRARED